MNERPAATGTPATREEVETALAALTDAQLVRLNRVSAYRHETLGARRAGRHEGDILSDAIVAILNGRRKWIRANVEFVPFLLMVMKSIASHIRNGRPLDAFDEIAPVRINHKDAAEHCVEQVVPAAPSDPEQLLRARQLDDEIRKRFDDDPEVLLVYEAFLEKMKPAVIQRHLGLTEKQYNAAAKRLRRAVDAMLQKGGLYER